MTPLEPLAEYIRNHYEVHEWRHASAVLQGDFPDEWRDIGDVLSEFQLRRSHIEVGGGSKSLVAATLDEAFQQRGWQEKEFDTRIVVDEKSYDSPTHKVDCYRNGVASEIEWNYKDPFFDRDLNNFRLLFELRAVSVGVIITRCDESHRRIDEGPRGPGYAGTSRRRRPHAADERSSRIVLPLA